MDGLIYLPQDRPQPVHSGNRIGSESEPVNTLLTIGFPTMIRRFARNPGTCLDSTVSGQPVDGIQRPYKAVRRLVSDGQLVHTAPQP
jgi:hypothetical protein